MAALGRFLLASLDAALRLLEALGARGSRWEWKKRTWRQRLQDRIASWENLERGVQTRLRMCRSCRTLVPSSERTCPACGVSMSGVPTGGVSRLVTLLLPGTGIVTILLVTANVVMSLVVLVVWGSAGEAGGLTSLLSPPWQALFLLGEKWTPLIAEGQVWRLVTANYLHGGLFHLFVNCYSLMNLGPLVEESFGARKTFVIYTITGICAFITSAVVRPQTPSIGASGALFGLLGFAVVYGRLRGGSTGRAISAHLMRWVILGLLMVFLPGIDSAAHVGGLLSGGALGLLIEAGEPKSRAAEIGLRLLTAGALLVTLGSFVAMALSYADNLALIAK
ncbi:MAG TPA: rhomboid family intramembrane serine protease [Candidatus Polarisedimenticolia bacterium]|nr:rhomboid family intramembrane serine protease [Candidatus Polarisedimenticolia bacterium]